MTAAGRLTMQRMIPVTRDSALPLFDVAETRRLEAEAAAGLSPHTLMQRAGLSVARLAMALAPHARTVWVACGPGNNGGDGLEAAAQLRQRGFRPVVTWLGDVDHAPADALTSLRRAQAEGVEFSDEPPADFDLAIDALLGIGSRRAPEGRMSEWLARMAAGASPVLSVDVPTLLDADTGQSLGPTAQSTALRHCLSLLTLKPGLFTAQGRDASGSIWFDDLGVPQASARPVAWLNKAPASHARAHGSHKGSYGDVAVIGGAAGMAGAARLAGSAALHGGAGRVFVAPLDPSATKFDAERPELMFRDPQSIDVATMTVVCGCGGGTAVRALLPRVLSSAPSLVLDADALNALALDTSLQAQLRARSAREWRTVMTPHPLEAARLLGVTTAQIQSDRLKSAQALAERFKATVVLKGSGSVIASPDLTPRINVTGNARLATAGTGDVLAGMIGALLAAGQPAFDAACAGVWHHGALADDWPAGVPLTASALARGAVPNHRA